MKRPFKKAIPSTLHFCISLYLLACSQPSTPQPSPTEPPPNNDSLNPRYMDPMDSVECVVDEDCFDQPMISVWYPTCDGDILQTPTGSGVYTCQQNICVMDFMIVETDCALAGQICALNPNDQGDICLDVVSDGITPETQCELINDISSEVGCSLWPV